MLASRPPVCTGGLYFPEMGTVLISTRERWESGLATNFLTAEGRSSKVHYGRPRHSLGPPCRMRLLVAGHTRAMS